MTPQERQERLRFLDYTEQDEAALRSLRPVFEEQAHSIVNSFYEHLLKFDQTTQLLSDHTTVDRLKKLQTEYLLRIPQGKFDERYFDERIRIGRTHERVGLSPKWYLSSYNLLFKLLTPRIFAHFHAESERAQAAIVALEKVFMLDASLAMEAYVASDRFRHLRQLESIVNDSADVIFMLDTDKRFRTWNRAAERILGWRAEEVLGKPVTMVVPPNRLRSGELARIDAELEKKGFCQLVTERLAKDGRHVPVEITLSVLNDLQGNPIGRSVILRDVTERRRLEEAKVQSERLAVIGAMSAKLAHEIRNPLSSIVLNIDLVGDEIETLGQNQPESVEESRALLKSIKSEVRRIQRVTEDYLQFARLPRIHRERIQLPELLASGIAFMESLFRESGISVRIRFPEDIPVVEADDQQFWQAVLNLIRNAIEAMPEGGLLRLELESSGNDVLLRVVDSGKGMTHEEREQIFRPFFSTKTGGTGLGLPLTQQIISEHGGTIECESAAGKGTTFTIRIPIAKES